MALASSSAEIANGAPKNVFPAGVARYVSGEGPLRINLGSDMPGYNQYETLLLQASTPGPLNGTVVNIGRPGLIVGVELAAAISDSGVAPANAMMRAYVTINSFQTSAPASGDGAVLAVIIVPIVAAAALPARVWGDSIFVPLACPVKVADRLILALDDPSPVAVSLSLATAIIHFQYA